MTYEEYKNAVYNGCKEYATAQANPEDFEKVFKEIEGEGLLKRQYERGIPPLGNCQAIILQV